jgi:hypothetical protein
VRKYFSTLIAKIEAVRRVSAPVIFFSWPLSHWRAGYSSFGAVVFWRPSS